MDLTTNGNVRDYVVTFKFEIPVRLVGGDKTKDTEEAYYKALEDFHSFSATEANIYVTETNADDYQRRKTEIEKLHNEKWYGE